MCKTAILIPCHNEEMTIGKVLEDFHRVLPSAKLYVCNNNSTDFTADIADKRGAKVINEPRLGKGNAVKTLFQSVDADIYILVDGDDTYDASIVKEMIECVKNGDDMVIADRLSSTYFEVNKRPFHNFGNRLVRNCVNLIFNAHLHDIMTGYRAFSKKFIKTFPISTSGFEIETEMTVHALFYNFRISEIKGNYKDRPVYSSSKLNTFRDGAKILTIILRLFRDYRPLLLFSIIALILTCISIGLFIPVFIDYLNSGLVMRFPTLIVSVFLMISAILLFSIGIILDAFNAKHRFNYEMKILQYLELNRLE